MIDEEKKLIAETPITMDCKEHKEKTWFEDYLKLFPKESQKETCRIVTREVCKKILDVIRTHEGIEQVTKFYISEIIKNLGVEV